MLERARIGLPGPIDLRQTLGRAAMFLVDPTTTVHDGALWSAFRTEDGPVAVGYRRTGEREVEVEAHGPGAERAIAMAPDHLGVHDEPERFEPDHPLLADLARRHRGLRFGRSLRIYERLVPTILGQKVTGAGATRSFRELVYHYGERAPGPLPKLWLQPTPETLRALSYADFHPFGVERKRADTILSVARRAKRLGSLIRLAPAEAATRLASLRGIGPWTIGHVLDTAFGDADAVPVGDYHMPNMVVFAFTGAARGDDARMLELLEPYRPHRGRVLALLALGGPAPPRFGPRLSVRDIRGS